MIVELEPERWSFHEGLKHFGAVLFCCVAGVVFTLYPEHFKNTARFHGSETFVRAVGIASAFLGITGFFYWVCRALGQPWPPLRSRRPHLIVTAQGIEGRQPAAEAGFLPWSFVEEVYEREVGGQRVVGLRLTEESALALRSEPALYPYLLGHDPATPYGSPSFVFNARLPLRQLRSVLEAHMSASAVGPANPLLQSDRGLHGLA